MDLSSSERVRISNTYRVIVIPIGSIEYHGGILPYNTDSYIAEALARKCLSRYTDNDNLQVFLYPTITLGYSIEWLKHSGTLTLRPETLLKLLDDIVYSIEYNIKPHGYIFVNAHGGNYSILEVFTRWKYYELEKPMIIIDVWRIAGKYGLKYCHACKSEVELYNHLRGTVNEGSLSIIKNNSEDREFDEDLIRGYYKELGIGERDSLSISINDFVKIICSLIDKAVNIIIDHSKK
jgi:creatinine amidohydrolase